jgi:hypothetical protein
MYASRMPALRARLVAAIVAAAVVLPVTIRSSTAGRERISIDEGWRFTKDDPPGFALTRDALLPWLLPTSDAFISDPAKRQALPAGRLDGGPYAQRDSDDRSWRLLDLPHDWGVEGPFSAAGSGARGRLPFYGGLNRPPSRRGSPSTTTRRRTSRSQSPLKSSRSTRVACMPARPLPPRPRPLSRHALVIVRPARGATGTVRITATADGLKAGTITVRVVR